MRLDELALVLGNAALVYQSYKLTPEAIKAWHGMFADEDSKTFAAAFRSVMLQAGREWFPTPGEVAAQILVLKRDAHPPAVEVFETLRKHAAAGLSLEDVRKRAAKYPAVLKALRQIDWREYQFGDLETMPYRRRDFIQIYNQCVESCQAETLGQEAIEHQDILGLVGKTAAAMKRIQ